MVENELVAVMVPKHHLSKVYGFIAQLESASPTATSTPTEPAEDTGDWTSARVRRMVQESPQAMRDVLKAMADKAGAWVSVHDLASAISDKPKADWNTVAGVMGAFGRRVKNRYGIDKMPFEKRYDHAAHCKMFRMSKEIAGQVLQALQNGQ
jgi:hypothetical protein